MSNAYHQAYKEKSVDQTSRQRRQHHLPNLLCVPNQIMLWRLRWKWLRLRAILNQPPPLFQAPGWTSKGSVRGK